jgi:hypothetical protein
MKNARVFYPLLLLILPLIGMCITKEVNWSLYDFIKMGALILAVSTVIRFILHKTKNVKNRIIYLGIIGLIFFLIWAELAVGIFGTPFAGN